MAQHALSAEAEPDDLDDYVSEQTERPPAGPDGSPSHPSTLLPLPPALWLGAICHESPFDTLCDNAR